jgi:hypothetical protein
MHDSIEKLYNNLLFLISSIEAISFSSASYNEYMNKKKNDKKFFMKNRKLKEVI